ncbi:hypothetical protein FALBO_3018 [Fusarium albosuccineum]|uniref:Uncharacterized protein n=1 Tax=Fusarium albosuccineum TaxID=1237068 RepID=A0A8H4PGC0_9HYPO|nr:hypothetical protein FALBO_3018 [Fusarium albosuccineum]
MPSVLYTFHRTAKINFIGEMSSATMPFSVTQSPLPRLRCSSIVMPSQLFPPEFVQPFAYKWCSGFRSWLLLPWGKVNDLCDSYRRYFDLAKASKAAGMAANDHENLLQLPFIVALGLMTQQEVSMRELARREDRTALIERLQSWIARSLSEILDGSSYTICRIRALLLAALYFQHQLQTRLTQKLLDAATARFKRFIEWASLSQMRVSLTFVLETVEIYINCQQTSILISSR